MKLLSLDTGHLTDEELGIDNDLRRAMEQVPKRIIECARGNKSYRCVTCGGDLKTCTCVV